MRRPLKLLGVGWPGLSFGAGSALADEEAIETDAPPASRTTGLRTGSALADEEAIETRLSVNFTI